MFFLLRPELWARLMLRRVDPRPAALVRIGFGLAVLATFVDYLPWVRLLFTDEGIWLTGTARDLFGSPRAPLGNWSLLHLRSDPIVVYPLYGALLGSLVLMILGVWTRWTTALAWLLAEQLYRYSPVFQSSGDTVVRVFLFLGMLTAWGEAYSVDSWRRRARAVLGGATEIPPLRGIPAWPLRLMALQVACIYFVTGLLKSGLPWRDGSAIYYALNLDAFYRVPAQGLIARLQDAGVLPLLSVITPWWETLFPAVVAGALLQAYERARRAGEWGPAGGLRRAASWSALAVFWALAAWVSGVLATNWPARDRPAGAAFAEPSFLVALLVALALPAALLGYRLVRERAPWAHSFLLNWVLGKRFWLTTGLGIHLGIELGMNIGTFPQLMLALYPCFLSGREVDGFWHWLLAKPARSGEGGRPIRRRAWVRLALAPLDRARYREPRRPVIVHHHPGDAAVRRAALLRLWDWGDRLRFVADATMAPGALCLELEGRSALVRGGEVGIHLAPALPALWWTWPAWPLPVTRRPVGALILRLLRQASSLGRTRTG
ncbi:MAG TPA: hypothetical protein VML54_08915 [Candidatus Limnocylindrales bacterium]|nr:hypothetical protein [Candidatus Limnocylindrales bacterium]